VIPSDALAYGAKILKDHFALFVHFEEEIEEEVVEEVDEEFLRIKALLERSVEELELSVRSSNCLKAANIKTIGDLVTKSEGEMLKYRNFGRKSLKEIADILANMKPALRHGRSQVQARREDRGGIEPCAIVKITGS
jgi:DNA-directed RNA polymerase subunit alpha